MIAGIKIKKKKKVEPRILRAGVTACMSSYGMSTICEGKPYAIPFDIVKSVELYRKWLIGPPCILLSTDNGDFRIEGDWGRVNFLMTCIEYYHELYNRH